MREDGVHTLCTETVAAGHGLHASLEVTMGVGKLREGVPYTIRAEFLGHIAESRFSVVVVPWSATRKPAKKKAKKKTGGKAGRKNG